MHLSMKLFDMFDQTPPHTLDKILANLVPIKKISKLDLQPKGQGHSKKAKDNNPGNKKKPPLKTLSMDSLVTDVQLIRQQVMNDLLTIIKVGQQRSKMITARRFLGSKNQFQLAILEFGCLGQRIASFSSIQHTHMYFK